MDQAYRGFTDNPQFRNAEEIAGYLSTRFTDGEYDRVILVYNNFESAMSQQVLVRDLLPLTDELLRHALDTAVSADATGDTSDTSSASEAHGGTVDAEWIFEPTPEGLLDRLVPTYVEQTVFRALLESTASEHGARMTAMRSASDNAGDMIDDLTLARNRARQAAITQEILEVVAGADAL